jgi:hypothetical protein
VAYLARSVLGPPAHVGLCPRLEKVNGMIRGMLSGTQTFEDAFCKMVQGLFLDFVTACERMVEQWILTELTQTSTTATQTAVRGAIQEQSNTADLAGLFERALKAIGASVQETFAGARRSSRRPSVRRLLPLRPGLRLAPQPQPLPDCQRSTSAAGRFHAPWRPSSTRAR